MHHRPHRHCRRACSDAIETETLQSMSIVIFLGGVTTRKECEAATNNSVMQENVASVANLITRMKSDQYLIFASTGAIAEGSGGSLFGEEDTPNEQLLDCLSSSLLARERMAAQRANTTNYRGPVLVALRFGSVVGVSPVQRMESAHVAMTRHAALRGEVPLFHPETWSAFLSIHDQVRAVETIMLMRHVLKRSTLNVFNLVSFNSRQGQAASEVAQATGARIMAQHHPSNLDIKGFSLSGEAMENTFGFHTEWTPRRVAEDLAAHLRFVSRDDLFSVASSQRAHRCHVCGSGSMMKVLDLGNLPRGDRFPSTVNEEYPHQELKYMKCPKCGHNQPPSPTESPAQCTNEQMAAAHCEKAVAHAAGVMPVTPSTLKRSVLVVSCGESQLADLFLKQGWIIYVLQVNDDARKLKHGRGFFSHKCKSLVKCSLPSSFSRAFDAIAVTSVVGNPTQLQSLLATLAVRLSMRGILYCDVVFADGFEESVFGMRQERFDYFTGRSLQHLANRAGMRPVSVVSATTTITSQSRLWRS